MGVLSHASVDKVTDMGSMSGPLSGHSDIVNRLHNHNPNIRKLLQSVGAMSNLAQQSEHAVINSQEFQAADMRTTEEAMAKTRMDDGSISARYDLSSMRYDRDTAFLPDFLPQRVSKRGIIEPYRESDGKGGTFGNAPINPIIANSIPDIIVPPETDAGTVPALTWDFTMSHIKLQPGGWTSQTTIR